VQGHRNKAFGGFNKKIVGFNVEQRTELYQVLAARDRAANP
jgi:hypothetical protein